MGLDYQLWEPLDYQLYDQIIRHRPQRWDQQHRELSQLRDPLRFLLDEELARQLQKGD